MAINAPHAGHTILTPCDNVVTQWTDVEAEYRHYLFLRLRFGLVTGTSTGAGTIVTTAISRRPNTCASSGSGVCDMVKIQMHGRPTRTLGVRVSGVHFRVFRSNWGRIPGVAGYNRPIAMGHHGTITTICIHHTGSYGIRYTGGTGLTGVGWC